MLKTKSGLPKHCCWHNDRHGTRRVRFRKAGLSAYLKGTPWGEDFMRQYAALLDRVAKPGTVGAERTKPGTVAALVAVYFMSPEFRSLKESTQAHRRRIIEKFRADYGDLYLNGLRRKQIEQIMAAKAETPEAANNLVKLLRVMLNYGISLDMIASNPAIGVKRYKSHGQGFHTLTEDEIAKFEATHAVGTKARLAFALLLYTGQRVSDVCRMGWQHVVTTVDGDKIKVQQQKTGRVLLIPLHNELVAILATQPRTNMTFMVTQYGAPFTAQGLGHFVKKMCVIAGLPHCSAHGLRKGAARRFAEAGCSVNEIAAFMGHKSLREVERYTSAADQERLARQALNRQLRAEGERELSNLRTQIVQPKGK